MRMTGLHETPITQSVKIVGYTSSLFASSLMLIAGIMKVIGAEQMQLKMARVTHFEDKIQGSENTPFAYTHFGTTEKN